MSWGVVVAVCRVERDGELGRKIEGEEGGGMAERLGVMR
jgi:hypothetical protein